jgi:hypothetical protein
MRHRTSAQKPTHELTESHFYLLFFISPTQGSPAAHRLFHLQVLPHLSRQFQSPQIQEAIQVQRHVAAKQLDGGVVVP